jgi:hypothetical protein
MNITIYINRANEKLLAQVPNKGGLINQLLAEYFIKEAVKALDEAPVPTENRSYIDEKGEIHSTQKKYIRLPDGKKTIRIESTPPGPNAFHKLTTDKVSSLIRPDIKQCPHGFAIGMCKKQDCNRKYKK